MKVIHLISGGDTGGARTHVYSLLKYLGQIIDVQLVCFRGGDFADGAAALGIPTMVLDRGFAGNLGALKKLIRAGEYDLVHCHGSMANVMGAMLRRSVRVPVISTVHSDYRLDYLGRPFARAVYGTLNIWALHQLDYRVCVSDPIRQRLIDRGFEPNRLFSIYNGLDFSHVVPKTDRAAYFAQFGYTVHEGDVIAGIAARLDPVKDIPTLIRAVALAQKACPQLRLAIAGDGKERKKLEALTKELDLEDSVFFLGWVNDLDSFYGALDINTLSSVSEAFPYALPEGARAHLATVASNVGGVPAIIEHGVTGLLIEPGDVRMLAAYLARFALDADYRHEMGEALYRRGKADFSEEATGLRQLEIYHAVFRMERNRRDGVRDGVLICGALAGMGAAMLYLTSYEQWQCSSSSVPAMGFNGIAAAFLGGLNPIGSIFASFFIQHITAGGAYVDKSMYCAQISDLISALIIYLCGFVLFMKNVMSSIAARREEKAIAKARALAEAKKGGETE